MNNIEDVIEENKTTAINVAAVVLAWVLIRSAVKSGGKAAVKYAVKHGLNNININLLS